jgi:iron complex transport system ATP-binding protein
MALACENVEFAFVPGKPVLSGVSAVFQPGRVTVVLGPNGSGKSTLLRLLLGVLRPSGGRVTLEGRETVTIGGATRAACIAYIAQRAEGWSPFRVRDVVGMSRHALPADGDAVEAALAATRMAALADEPMATLSVGQQQRVAVARVVAQVRGRRGGHWTARCVLGDEPVSAMDPAHARRTMSLFRELASEGVGVVLVLHDFTLAAREADDAVLLDGCGRVAARGTVDAVLRPDVLAPVFGTGFERLDAGGPVVVATGAG